MKNLTNKIILLLTLFLIQCQSHPARIEHFPYAQAIRKDTEVSEARGKNRAMATQGIYATKAAEKIFEQGGNAIDAAVAASFVISVERPHSTGIGGGGFMLFREGKSKKVYAIDFRERAPLKAKTDMFLGPDRKANSDLSQNGILASGVPGLVAGLLEIHERFGKLPLEVIMAPAIALAEDGFAIYPTLHKAIVQKEALLAKDPGAQKIFLDENKKARPLGSLLIQKDLANTLRLIAKNKRAGFYDGSVAEKMLAFSEQSHGLFSNEDLKNYQVKWREPLLGEYKGHQVFSMPPPSSGGVHVIQFLNMLEGDEVGRSGVLSTAAIHLAAQALQSAFSDRAKYLGDPDFVSVPTDVLISKKYAEYRRSQFFSERARKASEVEAGNVVLFPVNPEHSETTHLSIMDKNGDIVSTTQTINGYLGASIVVPGTGIVLNNEMDDFTAEVGAANLFGAIGGKANTIAPMKTPLSSMSPTIVVKNDQALMSLGAPGGTRIISCVAQTLLNYLEFKLPLFESIAAVRYHHQWKPDVLDMDPPGPGDKTMAELQSMGYSTNLSPVPCNVMAVVKEGEQFIAVSDPRDIGTSAAR